MRTILFYLLILITVHTTAIGQTTITIASGTALTADHHSGPIYRSSASSTFDYSQYAYLYTASELSAMPAGSLIKKIAWNKTNTGATTGAGKLTIYLKNSNTSSYTTSTPFSTLISGATVAFSSTSVTIPATAGFIQFSFPAGFTYTGGSLEVMVDWDISSVAGDPSTSSFLWQKNTVQSKILGYANSAPITASLSPTSNSIGTITNTRPAIQLTFDVSASPCTGTPAGGITNGADSVCSGIDFSLDVVNGTTNQSGLSWQWQYSGDSLSWTNFGTPYDSAIVTSQTSPRYYRRIIKCGANADTSHPKLINLKSRFQCYCKPAASNCSLNDVISNVTISSINKTSACSSNGYVDYTDSISPAPLQQLVSYPISVKVGPGGIEYAVAWIDYNQNSIFDANEFTSIGSGNGVTLNNSITIPGNIPAGLTKMRIRVKYNSAISESNSCATFVYGETEDYMVNILPSQPCNGTPVGGVTRSLQSAVCSGDSVLLYVDSSTTGVTGLAYQWQFSGDSIAWYNIPGKTNLDCIVKQDSAQYYRRQVNCGSNFNVSTPIKLEVKNANLCYCKPDSSACSTTGSITKLVIGNINNSSSCSPGGYFDYSNTVPANPLQAGVTVPVTISTNSVSTSFTNYFYIWIDHNQNGVFDSTECTFLGTRLGTGSISGNITIPANALTGVTGMRIRAKFNGPITANDACTGLTTGETEDYTVNILPPSSCTNNLTAGIISGPVDICGGFNFELVNNNATDQGGIKYSWQYSTDSISWFNINNTNTLLRKVIVSQPATRFYRLVDSCANGNTSISNAIKVRNKTGTIDCHCVPAGSSVCTIGDLIIRVIFGSIDTTSYCSANGYSNDTSLIRRDTITANSSKIMKVQVGGGRNPEYIGVWIDFNQNGVFDRSEFSMLGKGFGSTVTNSISFPSDALAGNTRMRIRVTGDTALTASDACTHFNNGETEDYRVHVIPSPCPVNTWTGSSDNNWSNPLNWSCGVVPGLHSVAVVNGGTLIINSNVTLYSLSLSPAATVTVLPPYSLTVTH